ncbi:unnamed protein product, partial [Scytosiphon promiscuus]
SVEKNRSVSNPAKLFMFSKNSYAWHLMSPYRSDGSAMVPPPDLLWDPNARSRYLVRCNDVPLLDICCTASCILRFVVRCPDLQRPRTTRRFVFPSCRVFAVRCSHAPRETSCDAELRAPCRCDCKQLAPLTDSHFSIAE